MPENDASSLPCDLLVFDLDGTLIDSAHDLANSVNASLAHLQRPSLPREQIAGFIGDGASALLSRALSATGSINEGILEQALTFFIHYYREHLLDTTYVYPGVLNALQQIRAVTPTLPMAILTNKPVNASVSICNGLGISPFFFANYGGNSFSTKKPDPLGLHTIMEQAALVRGAPVAGLRTVLIGDSHVDVETAHAAGVLSLGCSYGLDPARLHAAKPDAVADSPSEWFAALRSLLGAEH